MSVKIGIQVYTVRDHAAEDLEGTLKKLAEYGYEGVQFAGYYDFRPEQLQQMLDRYGLKAPSTHVALSPLAENTPIQIAYAKALGMQDITISSAQTSPLTSPETFETVRRIQKQAQAAGLTVGFHNHYHEFAKENGEYKLDIFYRSLPGVRMELDTYWCAYAGVDPVEYMKQHKDRLSHIHIKDMKENPDERQVNANIGEGCLDIRKYLDTAGSYGVEWAFVEMDRCDGDSLECARISRRNLTKMGY